MSKEALIIDDDQMSFMILKQYLMELGIYSTGAVSFEDGLAMLDSKFLFNYIFLDLLLPGIGGLEFLRLKRRLPVYEKTPVIVVSGLADVPSIAEAIREGANSYLIKPFQKELLIEAIQKLTTYSS